jgi:hypothetical protein
MLQCSDPAVVGQKRTVARTRDADLSAFEQQRVRMNTLQIHATWRVYVAMVVAQVPAALVGALAAPTGDGFIDLWYGAAFGLPIGFVGGLLWQLRAGPETVMRHRLHVIALGIFAAALPVLGVLTYDTLRQVAAAG